MPIRIVRLGEPRFPNEGIRFGTVRRPPRGVPKSEFSTRNFYDVWLPELAPSPERVKMALAAKTKAEWSLFEKGYRAEMKQPAATRWLLAFAALSHTTSMSMGCYCEHENRCHRSILRALLLEHNAEIV